MWKLWKSDSGAKVSELENRVRQLEADMKTIELEWNEVWHKMRKALGRVTKTEALEERKNRIEETETEDPMVTRERIVRLARERGH